MVDVPHTFNIPNRSCNVRKLQPTRSAFHEDMDRIAQHTSCAAQNQQADADGYQGIKQIPSGVVHNDTANDYSHRCGGVANHMQEGASHIQVVMGVAAQGRGRQQVHHQANDGDAQHGKALYHRNGQHGQLYCCQRENQSEQIEKDMCSVGQERQ